MSTRPHRGALVLVLGVWAFIASAVIAVGTSEPVTPVAMAETGVIVPVYVPVNPPPTPPTTAPPHRAPVVVSRGVPRTHTVISTPNTTTSAGPKPVKPQPKPLRTDYNWSALRMCESHGNYSTNTGNGYYGAYQFSAKTWHSLGYTGLPHEASPDDQDEAAQKLLARSGWRQWPVCGRLL